MLDVGTGLFVPWHSYCEWKVSLDRRTKYEIVIQRTFFDIDAEQIEIDIINSLGDVLTYPDVDLKLSAESIINVENGSSFVIRALNSAQNYTQETYFITYRTVTEFSTGGVVIGSGSGGDDSGGDTGSGDGGDTGTGDGGDTGTGDGGDTGTGTGGDTGTGDGGDTGTGDGGDTGTGDGGDTGTGDTGGGDSGDNGGGDAGGDNNGGGDNNSGGDNNTGGGDNNVVDSGTGK